jgi:hypothetical protein
VFAVGIKDTVGEFSQSMKSGYIDLQNTRFAPAASFNTRGK